MYDTYRDLLPPEALGLPKRTYDALLQVASDLETGKLVHVPLRQMKHLKATAARLFNMSVWQENVPGCGTACCIGGWLEIYLGGPMLAHHRFAPPRSPPRSSAFDGVSIETKDTLWSLFYPDLNSLRGKGREEYDLITPREAASCIRNYLKTGDVDWVAACAAAGSSTQSDLAPRHCWRLITFRRRRLRSASSAPQPL